MPLAALGAMASYVPAVMTNISAFAEVFENEKTVLLVEPDDPEALAEAIKRLLQDEGLRRKLALAAREKVIEEFDLEKQVSKMVKYYQKIL